MSLLRLLSAGKSLVGIKEGPARYRMSDPRVMPRFGSGRNPFQSRKAVEPEPLPTAAPDSDSAAVARPEPEPEVRPEPAVNAGPAVKRTESRLTLWVKAPVRKVAGWFRRRERPRPAVAKRPGPVQGELSLDLVRVVRNDLSDSDFEVVARKPAPATVPPVEVQAIGPAAVAPGVVVAPEVPECARSRMATRLFCAGKS